MASRAGSAACCTAAQGWGPSRARLPAHGCGQAKRSAPSSGRLQPESERVSNAGWPSRSQSGRGARRAKATRGARQTSWSAWSISRSGQPRCAVSARSRPPLRAPSACPGPVRRARRTGWTRRACRRWIGWPRLRQRSSDCAGFVADAARRWRRWLPTRSGRRRSCWLGAGASAWSRRLGPSSSSMRATRTPSTTAQGTTRTGRCAAGRASFPSCGRPGPPHSAGPRPGH